MYSHYAQEATSYANMRLSVHERIDDLHRRAHGLAPAVEESALDSGCTDGPGTNRTEYRALGPRQRMAWDMVAEAHGWNAISDKPAMLAEAERRETAGEPYFVGYDGRPVLGLTVPLALDADSMFRFGVWGPDQPLEVTDDEPTAAELAKDAMLRNARDGGQSPAEILSAQNLRFARESNIDPHLPGHGDMSRCTDSAPCGDSGCSRCVPSGPEWWRNAVAGKCSHGGHDLDETCSDAPAELVGCDQCSAPCDGTLTAYSELFGEDLPVCPDCHAMLALVSPDEVTAMGLRGAAEDTSAEDAYAAQYLATDGFTREAGDLTPEGMAELNAAINQPRPETL